MSCCAFPMKLPLVDCHKTSLMIRQHLFKLSMAWCLRTTSHFQANVDPDLCHHMVSLLVGHNELIGQSLGITKSNRSVSENKHCHYQSVFFLQLLCGWHRFGPFGGGRGVAWNEITVKSLNIRCTESPNLNVSRLVLQLSLHNILKLCVKWRMRMQLVQRRQAMIQLHLSDEQFNWLLKCVLY